MAQTYTRQSTLTDGDTITASLFNNEYNQIVNAFAYSSTDVAVTGHRHDGSSAQGGNIPIIGDLNFFNKIVVDGTNNRWGIFVEVAGGPIEQVRIQDGAIVPVTTNDIDLGTAALQFKDIFIDGTANIDSLVLSSGSTVTAILDEDNLVSDSATALATQQSIKAYVDAQVTAQDLDIVGDTGTDSIDLDSETLTFTGGTGITSVVTAGTVTHNIDSTVTTLTGTQTLTNKTLTAPVISGDLTTDGNIDGRDVATDGTKLDGIEALADVTDTANVTAAGALMDSELTNITAVKALNQGVATTDSPSFAGLTATTADINAGTIDGTVIGGTTAAAGSFTTGAFSGEIAANGGIALGDGDVATFGAGDDLQIYHDGSVNVNRLDSVSSSFAIKAPQFVVQDAGGTKNMIWVPQGGSGYEVKLSHDGNTKLATTATGIDVTGIATMDGLTVDGGRGYIFSGDGYALGLAQTAGQPAYGYIGTETNGDVKISDTSANKIATFHQNQNVSFYDDTGTTPKFFWDASAESLGIGGDLTVSRTGANAVIYTSTDTTTNGSGLSSTISGQSWAYGVNWGASDGRWSVYDLTAGAERFSIAPTTGAATFSGEISANGGIALGDNGQATFGAGDDLQIYHDGSNSYIRDTGTGNLNISADQLRVLNAGNNEIKAAFTTDGAVDLYHNNALKLATTATGIDVTGTATMDGLEIGDNQWIYAGNGADLKIGHDGTDNIIRAQGSPLYIDANGTTFRGYSPYTKHMDIASNGDISFYEDTGTTPKFVWSSAAESLGIGGTPNYKLNVLAAAGAQNIFQAGQSGISNGLSITSDGTNLTYSFLTGNVGIGTSNPVDALDITLPSGTASRIRLLQTGYDSWQIGMPAADAAFTFANSGSERFRIASDGSLSTTTLGTSNVRFGVNAGNSIIAGGDYNTVVGDNAGTAITTGNLNVAMGYEALGVNVAGDKSVAVGVQALYAQNPSGNADMFNTAVGYNAGTAVTTGTQNTLIGGLAGDAITTASDNTAVGFNSLGTNTTGIQNTAVGSASLDANTTGIENTAVGYAALTSSTTAAGNTAVGWASMQLTTTGYSNVAVGLSSLGAQTTGIQNVAIGYQALDALTTASNNTAVGYASLGANTTGPNNTALGRGSLGTNTTGAGNVALGYSALASNTTAANNVAIGMEAAVSNTTGTSNVAVGFEALKANTTASNNTAVGHSALTANTTGAQNTAVGGRSQEATTTGGDNTSIGWGSLVLNTTGASNTALGRSSLAANTTASNNTAVGYHALLANTTGLSNTAVGHSSGSALTTANQNTFIGVNSGNLITTGANNTVIGAYDGNQGGLDIRTANNHIVLSDGDGNPRSVWDNAGNMYMWSSGSGIYLGGSSSANLLDDYEEGTWTPVLSFGGASVGVTYFAQQGYYTKVGRLVQATGKLYVNAVGSSTGDLTITGLPFALSPSTNSDTAVAIRTDAVSYADVPAAYIIAGTTYITFTETTNAGTGSNLTNSNITFGSSITFTASYFI